MLIKSFRNIANYIKMMNLISRYNQLLVTHPYKTKMITAGKIHTNHIHTLINYHLKPGLMFFGGDAICQLYINKTPDGKRPEFDWKRAAKMTAVGACYLAPLMHLWYGFGPRKITSMFPYYSSFSKAFITMCIDQTFFAMPITFGLLFGTDYLDDFNTKRSLLGAVDIFPTVIVNNWLVWPAASLITFGLIRGPFRVLWANTVGFFWNIYVSYVVNNRPHLNQIMID